MAKSSCWPGGAVMRGRPEARIVCSRLSSFAEHDGMIRQRQTPVLT